MTYDFLVIGGGINGLLVSRELAREGVSVGLVEQGLCGKEASWAGGGIVSPLYPWRYTAPITALATWAQGFYPVLVQQLLDETGIDAQHNRTGLLMLNTDELASALSWAASCGSAMEVVDHDRIAAMEAGIAPGFHSGLWMPDVANIRNPRLIKALVTSLGSNRHVDIFEQAEVKSLLVVKNRIEGVCVQRSGSQIELHAGTTVVCAGAWAGQLLKQLGLNLPVEPVKGQMLLYQPPAPVINSIVLTDGRYVIPRQDGLLLVGSTLEYTGFDKSVTQSAAMDLKSAATALLPALSAHEPIAQWAGLRPAAPQGLPFIGRIPDIDNLYINAGQFRNGLVLAPASARLAVDSLLERQPIVDPFPYLPETRLH